jgi:hypothetical protein
MHRTRRVPIYVDDSELQRIRVAAAHAKLSMSDFGRQAVMARVEEVEKMRAQGDTNVASSVATSKSE